MKPEKREQLREYARPKLRKISAILDGLAWQSVDPNVTMVMKMDDEQLAHYCRVQKQLDKANYKPPQGGFSLPE